MKNKISHCSAKFINSKWYADFPAFFQNYCFLDVAKQNMKYLGAWNAWVFSFLGTDFKRAGSFFPVQRSYAVQPLFAAVEISLIVVKRKGSVFAGINTQSQFRMQVLSRVFQCRAHGKNRTAFDIQGNFIQRRVRFQRLTSLIKFSCPELKV